MATILIVDDRPANREFLVTLLGYESHRLLEAGDGAEALAVVRAERPDLVICDVLMPTMDGYEFVRQLRAERKIARTTVIFYTAHFHEREAQNLARTAGVSHVLIKPCEPELVIRMVEEALGGPPQPPAARQTEAFDREHLRLVTDKLSQKVNELRVANQRLAALIEFNLELASQRDPVRLTEEVCRGARELIGARYGALGIRSVETDRIAHFVTSGINAGAAAEFGLSALDEGVLGTVMADRCPRRLTDLVQDPLTLGLPAGFPPVHSLLAAPLISRSTVYGWICLTEKLGASEFSDDDEKLLTILAAQFARIYENGNLYSTVQRHAAELQKEIVERKRAAAELRQSEERFRQMAENIRDVFFLINLDGSRVHYVSPAYEEVWGRSCESLHAQPGTWADSIHPDDRDYALAKFTEGMSTGFDYEHRITRPDGVVRWIRVRGFPILDEAGQAYRTAGVAADITERRQVEQRLLESETKYRQLIEQAPDGIFLSDMEGNYLLVNSRGCELLGYAEHEVVGMNAKETYLEEEREIHTARLEQIRTGQMLRFERMVKRKDGSTFPAEISLKMLDNGTLQAIFHDITTRRNQEQKIARLSRIQAVLSGINQAIVRIHHGPELFNEACRIAVEHGGFKMAWIGLVDKGTLRVKPEAWAGHNAGFLENVARLALDEGAFEGQEVVGVLRSKVPTVTNDFATNPHIVPKKEPLERDYRSGVVLPLIVGEEAVGLVSLYATEVEFFDDEEMKLLKELASDISFAMEYMEKDERLNYLAYRDALTGVANRSLLQDRLSQALHFSERWDLQVAVLVVDLDHFKFVNDALGHSAGDELLKVAAGRMMACVRDADTVARIGGDEFVLVLATVDNEENSAGRVAQRILEAFAQPVTLANRELFVTCSIGIALYPRDGVDAETLVKNADAAMYRAKEQGRNNCQFYTPEASARAQERLSLEGRLRRALERDEFRLHYQPLVDLRTGQVTGLEALIRWQEPELGMVSPVRFIRVAEETGLILPIGEWVLRTACAQNKAWQDQGLARVRVAVNLSAHQFHQKDLARQIKGVLSTTGLDPSYLEVELTESMLMQNVEEAISIMLELRAIGAHISLDDFGTGYSSLSYLKRFPIDTVKVDKSFVREITVDADSAAIADAIIAMGHSLRLTVLAEGVETEEQLAFLGARGCNRMQGYLFSKPLPPEELAKLLEEDRRLPPSWLGT